jgi:hypothetical protein
MQLLLRRRIIMGTPTSKFALWAKFDVTEDEAALIRSHGAANCYLTIEASRRDLWRAAVISFFIALILVGSLSAAFPSVPTGVVRTQQGMVQQHLLIPWWVWGFLFAFIFGFGTWLIYEQLRLAIRIQDMLDGREFRRNKSLVLMARRERQMVGYAHAFVQLLEKLQTWEGTETIEIGKDTEPALRLVTDAYNAAA